MPSIKFDRDFVAPAILGFGMQGLVDVSNQMEDPSKCLAAIPVVEAQIIDAICLVDECAYGAALFGEAVTRKVEPALPWWVVLGINVVPRSGVGEARDIADLVGPERSFGDVLVIDQVCNVDNSLWGKIVSCQVCDSAMAECAPAECKWGE